MKKFTISTTFVVLLFTLLPYVAKGQERVVPIPNREQLQSAHVRVLFQDSEGYMWYGMKMDGLYRDDGYSLTSFRADFLHPEIQMNNNIMALSVCGLVRNGGFISWISVITAFVRQVTKPCRRGRLMR